MPRSVKREPFVTADAILEAYATNERINQFLLEQLDERAWRADPPGGKGRTIAAIASHMHNVRHMWLTLAAKGTKVPDKLDRNTVTPAQARAALQKSHQAVARLLARSLASDGRIKDFRPDVVGFFSYAISHDAHHRGQICMLARQLGHPLPEEAGHALWDWAKRWKEAI